MRHLHALRRLLARAVLVLGGAALLVAVGYAGSRVLAPEVRPVAGAVTALFDEVQVGDEVVVYWS